MLLEIGACINRFFDRKGFDRHAYRRLRRQTSRTYLAPITRDYIKRLRAIEQDRPLPGGDAERFHAVKAYRESVVRLSLALVTAAVFDLKTLYQGMQAMRGEDEFEIIFCIVMQCQVIDDVLDYRKDKAAELPSFLTATTSRQASEGLTRHTVADYRDVNDLSRSKATLPFQIALWLVSACTSSVLIWTSQGANDTTTRRQ